MDFGQQLTAIFQPAKTSGYVLFAATFDVVKPRGVSLGQARDNLQEAVELFLEYASEEKQERTSGANLVAQHEVHTR